MFLVSFKWVHANCDEGAVLAANDIKSAVKNQIDLGFGLAECESIKNIRVEVENAR